VNKQDDQSPKPALDARRNAFRPDLAAAHLEGRVTAERFVKGQQGQILHAAVPMRKLPDAARGLETEALFGEAVTVFDEADGWAWVQLARDGYVGYLPAFAVRIGTPIPPTHRVQTLGTFVYAVPDIKTPPLMLLPMNALLTVTGGDERFAELQGGVFAIARHLAPIDRPARDFVEIAERFIGTPYLWGGCTRIGIDCSGLVQTSMRAANIGAPRDSDMQREELGKPVDVTADYENLERGDLVFWQGHVGIMSDSVMLVHANAHHMMVVAEPLPEAAARIAKAGGGAVTAIRRPAGAGPKPVV
jgi:cell wall-associated NlpC family hydrolase